MLFENVAIMGMGFVEPPHRIASTEIEAQLAENIQRFGMRPNLITELTGIHARKFWDPGVQASEVATQAAVRALEAANLSRDKVGIIISTSVSKDYIEPSIAALVHGNLGLRPETLNFDIGNACLGFLNGMEVAGNMLERQQIDYALIVNGESSRDIIESTLPRLQNPEIDPLDFRKRFATLTLGSAAVAMVLTRKELAPDGHTFRGGLTLAASQHNRLCLGQNHDMVTDASGLLKAGVELGAKAYASAQELLGWNNDNIDHYCMHQIGDAHSMSIINAIGVNPEKVHKIYPEWGNTGPTSIPLTMAMLDYEGQLQKGQRIAMLGIGSGINCSMMEVVW